MSKKKHSILFVILILGVTVLVLGTVMTAFQKYFDHPLKLGFSQKIGVIPIEGTIVDSRAILSQLVEFKKDKGIKAIILRIDSPGGGVGASQEIYREVRKTSKTKKIIVSMGGVAASGGYYIAAAGDEIVANPGTITGSIGVIMEFVQVRELIEKIGVGLEVIKSGEFKDIGSPHRQLSEKERELLNVLITDIQGQFVNAVAEGRGLSVEKVREIADGRILSGAMAKELGLVDKLGNFLDAVDLAKEMTGIEGDVNLVYPKVHKLGVLDLLLQSAARSLYDSFINIMGNRIEYRWDSLSYSLG